MSKPLKILAVMATLVLTLSCVRLQTAESRGTFQAHGAQPFFEMEDPVDDDHGLDTYMYPENLEFVAGAFDLLHFSVGEEEDKVLFELQFRTLGGNPWGAPNGFCLQIIEIYVNDGTGSRTTVIPVASADNGDNAHVIIENAWRWALRANGWPHGYNGEYNTHGRWENDSEFDIQVSGDTIQNKVYIKVPKGIVGSPSGSKPWWCTVLVGSDAAGRWRKVVPVERSPLYVRWMPGVGDVLVAACAAYENKVEPRPMDILVPAWTSQVEVLNAYQANPPSFTKVYAVGPVPSPPYFSVSMSPSSGIVRRGSSVQATVEVKRFLGYSSQVTLSTVGLPDGISLSFSPKSEVPPFSSTMTLTATEAAGIGSFPITIVATGADDQVKTSEYKLFVAAELFGIDDPIGDDDGPGTYKYPTNPVFQGKPGLFDITKFIFYTDEVNLYFVTTFAADRLGGNLWSGEAGFSFQLVEIYVDCKPGGSTMPVYPKGPAVKIDKEHPWDFAVQATGWYRAHKALRNWIAFAEQPEPITNVITVECDLAARTVSIAIPKQRIVENLGELQEESSWYAVVLSGSQDGFSPEGSWRFVYVDNRDMWQGSGADNLAYAMGVSPNVYDLIVPAGYSQHEILKGYDPELGEPKGYAEVPAFKFEPLPVAKPPELILPLIGGIVAIAVIVIAAIAFRKRS
ncbi:MAG: glucodextranase DOMON-like domain-containing protein [Hadesarchaea archaeon]|nr:glucodextranase DOMON-like domain-containing protein [Hadesarchaea archaeon]